jgi:hypothetical protein
MQDLGTLQDQFPGVSIPSNFSPASITHFLQIIFDIGQPSLFWPSNGLLLLLGYSENNIFTVLWSGILETRSIRRNISFLIPEVTPFIPL